MTHECETLKVLNFAPRCLVADNGWLCCGSEKGDFVAMRLDEDNDGDAVGSSLDLALDGALDTRMEMSREESLLSLITQGRRPNKNLNAKSMRLAKERVNCITLWFPDLRVPAGEGAYKESVAVLADNVGNVTLIGLRDFEQNEKAEPLDVINYPDFVNRALLSPDGRMLIAVLDDPYLYVHVREEKPLDPTSASRTPQYHWCQRQRIFLTSQLKEDRSDSRGSFAACFSNSGSLLAVGTQHGTISIFDTSLLDDPLAQPLITTFKSSRPESGPGAIRDMSFCPGPFDILAWTEDRGHVGIADVRANFTTRQILDIAVEADFDHINIFDRNTIDPRLLDPQSAVRRELLALQANAASSPRPGESTENFNQPLSATETVVLEALQDDRLRRDRARIATTDSGERSVPDLSWTYLSSLRPPADGDNSNRLARRSTSVTRGIRSTSSSRAQRSALDDYLDQRERARNRQQGTRDSSERLPALRRDPRWIDRLGETVAAMRDQRDRNQRDGQDQSDASYLNVLEILQARERATADGDNEDGSLLVPLVNQVVNRWEESAMRNTLPVGTSVAIDHGVFEVPPSRDNTAGLAWSEDGRTM